MATETCMPAEIFEESVFEQFESKFRTVQIINFVTRSESSPNEENGDVSPDLVTLGDASHMTLLVRVRKI